MVLNRLDLSVYDVLEAAGTKWNFLPFSPGLVGGHCIGIDPYYLLEIARDKNAITRMIKASRETNDGMAEYAATRVFSKLTPTTTSGEVPSVLVLGLTFKENVPDTRNSKSQEVVKRLEKEKCDVVTHDPQVNANDALEKKDAYDAILLLVPHKEYLDMKPEDFARLGKEKCLFYDLKSAFDRKAIEETGMTYLSL